MSEFPILFNGPMVRALLEGRKTQTRRVIKLQPGSDWHPKVGLYCPTKIDRHGEAFPGSEVFGASNEDTGRIYPFGQPGDRLWVRETWAQHADYPEMRRAVYRADSGSEHDAERWRPSIHMPRWAYRLVLEITDVRVERLQAISEANALAEGVDHVAVDLARVTGVDFAARVLFRDIWTSTGGDWDANPWGWVISFTKKEVRNGGR